MDVSSRRFKLIRHLAAVVGVVIVALQVIGFVGAGRNGGVLGGVSDWVFRWQPLIGIAVFGLVGVIFWLQLQWRRV